MKIRHIRNACVIIHSDEQSILVDPCLNAKGSLPPYAFIRTRPRRNPLVDLPPDSASLLNQVTCGLITHCRYGHFDHLDRSGIQLLAQRSVPVYCNCRDEPYLKRRHLHTIPLAMNVRSRFLTGSITAFPTAHGKGLIGMCMGSGAGYFVEMPGDKSFYISGDTVMTKTVRHVLTNLRPDIALLNAGTAALDLGSPILMPLHDQLDFIRAAPGIVIAVHLDAFNHCLTTRVVLRDAVSRAGLSGKVMIPADGELMEL